MISYCLGFAFCDHDNFVVLIRKSEPAWQKGLLNGVGGKIETGEHPAVAMAREFEEETGIDTDSGAWTRFTRMLFLEAEVHCFVTRLPGLPVVRSMTEELVGIYSMIDVNNHPKIIANLRWLIPMALRSLDTAAYDVPNMLHH